MLKYLRIAVTALCLTACVLLVAMWVRSYWRWDNFHGPLLGGCYTVNNSLQGQLSLGIGKFFGANEWGWVSVEASEPAKRNWFKHDLGYEPRFGFCISISRPGTPSPSRSIFFVPHWFAVMCAACLPVVAWIPPRFSLRTLLIATTLVALGLALIISTS